MTDFSKDLTYVEWFIKNRKKDEHEQKDGGKESEKILLAPLYCKKAK